jgi:hypothetical protein
MVKAEHCASLYFWYLLPKRGRTFGGRKKTKFEAIVELVDWPSCGLYLFFFICNIHALNIWGVVGVKAQCPLARETSMSKGQGPEGVKA